MMSPQVPSLHGAARNRQVAARQAICGDMFSGAFCNLLTKLHISRRVVPCQPNWRNIRASLPAWNCIGPAGRVFRRALSVSRSRKKPACSPAEARPNRDEHPVQVVPWGRDRVMNLSGPPHDRVIAWRHKPKAELPRTCAAGRLRQNVSPKMADDSSGCPPSLP